LHRSHNRGRGGESFLTEPVHRPIPRKAHPLTTLHAIWRTTGLADVPRAQIPET
jgi:hypothetical protein